MGNIYLKDITVVEINFSQKCVFHCQDKNPKQYRELLFDFFVCLFFSSGIPQNSWKFPRFIKYQYEKYNNYSIKSNCIGIEKYPLFIKRFQEWRVYKGFSLECGRKSMPHIPQPKTTLLKTHSITQCHDKAENSQDKFYEKVKPFLLYIYIQ